MALTLAQLQDYINTNIKYNGRNAISGDQMKYLMLSFADFVVETTGNVESDLASIVNFDQDTPTTIGVVFDPATPETEDLLYVSSTDASTWIWNGSAYITYDAPPVNNTAWYLMGTAVDAGNNKTASIARTGLIRVPTVRVTTATAQTIAYFDSNKDIKSLSTGTYPNLTELSYVKGVTSAVQTQIDSKQAALVSGTTIKTLNGASLLGSGNITISSGVTIGTTTVTSGTDDRILYQLSGVVQQSANLVFNSSGQLVIGGHTGSAKIDVKFGGASSTDLGQRWLASNGSTQIGKVTGDGAWTFGTYTNPNTKLSIDNGANIGAYIGGLKGVYAVGNAAGTAYGVDALGRSTTAGAISYGVYAIADGGGATGVNYALRGQASGAGTTNYAGYFDAISATNNYAIYVQRGNIVFSQANNVIIDTTTGTQWGTATGQKQSWWGVTPVVQQVLATGASHTSDDIITFLQLIGLCKQS